MTIKPFAADYDTASHLKGFRGISSLRSGIPRTLAGGTPAGVQSGPITGRLVKPARVYGRDKTYAQPPGSFGTTRKGQSL